LVIFLGGLTTAGAAASASDGALVGSSAFSLPTATAGLLAGDAAGTAGAAAAAIGCWRAACSTAASPGAAATVGLAACAPALGSLAAPALGSAAAAAGAAGALAAADAGHGVPIFYGLGNFMLRGARDMGAVPEFAGCRDYGLLARVHLRRLVPGGRFVLRAIEIVPIRDMHRQPAPFADPVQAARRIDVVNVLSARLDDPSAAVPETAHALFAARPDGVGVYCAAGAADDAPPVGALCRGWTAPLLPPPETQSEIMRGCVRPALSIVGSRTAKGQGKGKKSGKVRGGGKRR